MAEFSQDPIGDYLRVGPNKGQFVPANFESFTPQISVEDRKYGEIIRYFIRFVTHNSSSDIMEVSKTTFNKLKSNKFYEIVSVRWKVSGPLDDTHGLPNGNTSVRLVTGVVTANRLSIELADETLPGLKQLITDYKRFWQF